MATKTAVVTGGTSGLGEAAALALAAKGYHVMVVGRDAERGKAVVEAARAKGGEAELLSADLFTVSGVRALSSEILRRAPKVDLVVNNAGGTFGQTLMTEDGLERTFALNVMAPFVLTESLLPALASAKGRVVNLVTGIPKGAKATIEQLTGKDAKAGLGGYTRAKLALAALTAEQQRHHGDKGVTFVSLHPGIIPGTRFGQDMPAFVRAFGAFLAKLFRFGSTREQAAERYLRVATGDVTGGGFYDQGKESVAPVLARDPKFGSALWSALTSASDRPRVPTVSTRLPKSALS